MHIFTLLLRVVLHLLVCSLISQLSKGSVSLTIVSRSDFLTSRAKQLKKIFLPSNIFQIKLVPLNRVNIVKTLGVKKSTLSLA